MAAVSLERLDFELGDTVEHLKTGNLYLVFAFGKIEATLEDVVIYIEATKNGALPNGKVWVRPRKEMYDGRFLKTYY
jgi:hypothetical protein